MQAILPKLSTWQFSKAIEPCSTTASIDYTLTTIRSQMSSQSMGAPVPHADDWRSNLVMKTTAFFQVSYYRVSPTTQHSIDSPRDNPQKTSETQMILATYMVVAGSTSKYHPACSTLNLVVNRLGRFSRIQTNRASNSTK
ncbi:hypothetical protein FGO68_gene13637 [Halteria grandinella]|uniref:Uncharacterized protein n=1 Tax=Halteria grandinella TaxID=5974 RepID=A0A8J8NMM0_HALGN|nr:hypothetical protein FGO68_gene13637 [Halteria grandinella]